MTVDNSAAGAAGTQTERNAFYEGLRELKASCNQNKNDQAIVLIAACIDHGINTGRWIIGTLKPLGFNPQHLGKMLRDNAGSDPKRFWWQRHADGTYRSLHDQQDAASNPVGSNDE